MTDKLIAYCPEIKFIIESGWFYALLSNKERTDLIAAALIRQIKDEGKWGRFWQFAERSWWNADDATLKPDEDDRSAFGRWLTTPETLIRVAGEWVGREEGKCSENP